MGSSRRDVASLISENAKLRLKLAEARRKYADLVAVVEAGLLARQDVVDTDRRIQAILSEESDG